MKGASFEESPAATSHSGDRKRGNLRVFPSTAFFSSPMITITHPHTVQYASLSEQAWRSCSPRYAIVALAAAPWPMARHPQAAHTLPPSSARLAGPRVERNGASHHRIALRRGRPLNSTQHRRAYHPCRGRCAPLRQRRRLWTTGGLRLAVTPSSSSLFPKGLHMAMQQRAGARTGPPWPEYPSLAVAPPSPARRPQ
jgi:hypothetical protein